MSFQGSSGFTIQGGSFTYIAGDQNNYVQGNLVQYLSGERREPTIWDEFMRVPLGKIRIKKTMGKTTVGRYGLHESGLLDEKTRSWRNVNAHRTVNIASIHGEDKDLEFLHIAYSGPDAFETFRRDFEQFSRIRNVAVAQLFGYNDSQLALPALIFYDALVPVAHIFEQNGFSSLLYTYIEHLFQVSCTESDTADFGELWLHPRTGILCTGPYVDIPGPQYYFASGFETNPATNNEHPPLSLQTYNDSNALISYLTQTLSTQNIITGIRWCRRLTREQMSNENALFILSSLPGAVYSRLHLEVIAQWPGEMKEWYYEPWHVSGLSDKMQESWVDMGDGSVQITMMLSDIEYLQSQEIGIQYGLRPIDRYINFLDSWLLQTHYVLSQCGSQEDNLGDYSILEGFRLYLQCGDKEPLWTSSNIPADKPVYLFIQAIPCPSDSETTWNSWMQGPKYFWSFDSAGHETPRDIQPSLGFPSFTSRIEIQNNSWDHITYNALQQLHNFNGFNSTTTGFVQSLNLPILEMVSNKGRFEEIQESCEDAEDIDGELATLLSKLTISSEKN